MSRSITISLVFDMLVARTASSIASGLPIPSHCCLQAAVIRSEVMLIVSATSVIRTRLRRGMEFMLFFFFHWSLIGELQGRQAPRTLLYMCVFFDTRLCYVSLLVLEGCLPFSLSPLSNCQSLL